jgi:uncharacterized protein
VNFGGELSFDCGKRKEVAGMTDLEDVTRLPSDFNGIVRLFPLPELVVFPHAMQPLHIFEPRYCEMLLESLAGDHLIGMATLATGISDFLLPQPRIASTICIGKIVSHAETENGNHNLLLVGAKRAEIVRELPLERSFRRAEVRVCADVHEPADPQQRKLLRGALLDAFAAVIPASANAQQYLHELMSGQMGLGPITDIISYTLSLEIESKLMLLGEMNVERRARLLIGLLREISPGTAASPQALNPRKPPSSEFPPKFSVN